MTAVLRPQSISITYIVSQAGQHLSDVTGPKSESWPSFGRSLILR